MARLTVAQAPLTKEQRSSKNSLLTKQDNIHGNDIHGNDPQNAPDADRPLHRGFLSRSFAAALSVGSGVIVALTANSCAISALCTANTPDMLSVITVAAIARLFMGQFHTAERNGHKTKNHKNTGYLSAKTVGTIAAHMSLAAIAAAMTLSYSALSTDTDNTDFISLGDSFNAAPMVTPDNIDANSPETDMLATPHFIESGSIAPILPDDLTTAPPAMTSPAADTATIDIPGHTLSPTPEATPLSPSQISSLSTQNIDALPIIVTPVYVVYQVSYGDTVWDIVKNHYNLDTNRQTQQYADAVAVFNNMAGVSANHINVNDTIMLPSPDHIQLSDTPTLDWAALDRDAAKPGL